MNATHIIKARVSPEIKQLVLAAAHCELLTESIWLRRVVHAALKSTREPLPEVANSNEPKTAGSRLSIRLPAEDRLLLQERATARGIPVATYVSVLTRAHLRHLAPLPKAELLALRAAVSELGAIGRNLNQIARAANQGARLLNVERADLNALLKASEALRDHVKRLIKANTLSWSTGHAEARQ